MCGICGIFSPTEDLGSLIDTVRAISLELVHRGPDSNGYWVEYPGVAFGHTRLAIVDLSENGAQPMRSKSGRLTICFNGEVYNFKELRSRLTAKGVSPRGGSDTEVILECIDLFGLDWALLNARGMFAFALWDASENKLTLARDRLGEKPLYYGMVDGSLVFGSELKVFCKHPRFRRDLDSRAVAAFFKYSYVPTPLCIFKDVKKLPAAHAVSGTTPLLLFDALPMQYWSNINDIPREDRGQTLEHVLRGVVEEQMIADVPIGSFLSGGIDSSLITAIMQTQSERPVQSFTIGFSDSDFDESVYADLVAKELGTNHTCWVVDQSDVLDIIPSLPEIYDEPFADSSQIPTILLSKMTRQAVTVCLSGDGGDELFCGYERYIHGAKIYSWLSSLPRSARTALGWLLKSRNNTEWDLFYDKYRKVIPFSVSHFGNKVNKISALLNTTSAESFYDRLLSTPGYDSGVLMQTESYSVVPRSFDSQLSFTESMMFHDTLNYLTDDIMVKVDRATMSVGLESRAPFLDSRIYEYAWGIPIEEKMVRGVPKYPLRSLLAEFVPEKIIDRPKMGFSIPLGAWLRHELRDWVEHMLSEEQIRMSGFLNDCVAGRIWEAHKNGVGDHERLLWNMLIFQSWYMRWMGGSFGRVS